MIKSTQLQKPQLVLVVDDQEINQDILGSILEDDYELIYAADGVEALAEISAHRNELSIVLLDLIMPKMDGFEVLARIHEDSGLRHIPVIVLTAEKDAELRALQMGAADFITKPFDMHEVIRARVARIIELSEGRQLISNAEHDHLTGLYDRSFFFEYADRIFRYHRDWKMDAIVIDIEQFHSVNALNGREFGDGVLRHLGDEIRDYLGETHGIACRFEADLFYIYCETLDGYEALFERFQNSLDKAFEAVSLRLRMGVRPWSEEPVEPLILFDGAKAACNMTRGNYMTHLMVYDEKMRENEILHQRLINDLRHGLDEHQLVVYYQPKYNVQYDPPRLGSAEALIRWKHPELGMISPGVFIPLFEKNGLISSVDRFVWNEVAVQIARWKEKYGISVPVSVNLSRVDVFDPGLEKRLNRLVQDNSLSQGELKLEVTESAYTENADYMIETIRHLQDAGFEIEMDDFGSGYSSLNMLSSMPIDVLKMDMKFIRNIESSQKDFKMVELVLEIARYLKVPVVAEGVETEGQMGLLRDAGCDLIQGYYFSRPLPAEEFEKLIEKELERG